MNCSTPAAAILLGGGILLGCGVSAAVLLPTMLSDDCRQATILADQILDIEKSAGDTSARAIVAARVGDTATLDWAAKEFGRNADKLTTLEPAYNKAALGCRGER